MNKQIALATILVLVRALHFRVWENAIVDIQH